jgi:hypothetical protein
MNRKIIGMVIMFLGALIMAGIIYILFFDSFAIGDFVSKFKKEDISQEEITPDKQEEPTGPLPVQSEVKKIIVNQEEIEKETKVIKGKTRQVNKNDLRRMAASFAERFGSYSNQSNFSNIVDLKIFMSQRMRQWADAYISQQRQKGLASDIYYGITTKAMTQEVIEFDDDLGQAAILVRTRRREATSSTRNTSDFFNQNIIINFIQEKGVWKIDSANWQ